MNELIDKYRRLFERNGYEFKYAKVWNEFNNGCQHHFLVTNGRVICRDVVISDNIKHIVESLGRVTMNTSFQDKNFKTVFKEDVVLKLLAKVDEHIR